MALLTFSPSVSPSPGTENTPEFAVLSASFGDGYSSASEDGINNVRDVVALNWEFLLPVQAKAITDFLRARKGTQSFWWTPSNETTPIRWTCKAYTDKRGDAGFRAVTATFRRSFNLDA